MADDEDSEDDDIVLDDRSDQPAEDQKTAEQLLDELSDDDIQLIKNTRTTIPVVTKRSSSERDTDDEGNMDDPDHARGTMLKSHILSEPPATTFVAEYAFAAESGEPLTFKQAMLRDDAKQWRQACDAEIQALIDNGTWDLVDLPAERKPI